MSTRRTATPAIASLVLVLSTVALTLPGQAFARKSATERLVESGYAALTAEAPVKVPSAGELEVAYSPNGGSTALVVKVIASARLPSACWLILSPQRQ